MKNKNRFFLLTISLIIFLQSCESFPGSLIDAISGASIVRALDGNSLFHQTEEQVLIPGELEVKGEILDGGKINFKDFYKREVFVKEAVHVDGKIEFIGAFRYIGYSLFDLLHPYISYKKNHEEFPPLVDLFIKIENDKGESVIFSWSEIFHVINPHQIIIATEYAPIKPYKKEVEYDAGELWKVVAGNDFLAFRNLENPVSISVFSFDQKDYVIGRDIRYKETSDLKIDINGINNVILEDLSIYNDLSHSSISYGMGMGHRKHSDYSGVCMQSVFMDFMDTKDESWIRAGLVCFVSVDGYRAIYSFSELFNRTDKVSPVLAIINIKDSIVNYRNYMPTDFYIDRSVKSLGEIYLFKE